MKLLLQFPEGLKKEALAYAEKYRKEGHEVALSAAPCYGACDLALDEAKAIGADKIIHFGHSEFKGQICKKFVLLGNSIEFPIQLKSSLIPVEYIEWHDDADLEKIRQAAKKINEKKIALATTVQHIHQFKELRKIFEAAGKQVFTGKGALCAYEGQLLGCDFSALMQKEAEAAVIIAGGHFHAVGVLLAKPVYAIHPKTGEVKLLTSEIEKAKKRRKGAVLKAVDARSFGIMLSTKPGQFKQQLAESIAKKIRAAGRKAEIIVANSFDPITLNNFMFDAFVNTACPRIVDDQEAYGKPILNPDMLEEVLEIWKQLK